MIAVECKNCGRTSYSADSSGVLPCPYCGSREPRLRLVRPIEGGDRLQRHTFQSGHKRSVRLDTDDSRPHGA